MTKTSDVLSDLQDAGFKTGDGRFFNAVSEITKLLARVLELEKKRDAALSMLTEQDYEYNRKTNALIKRHAEQLAAQQLVIQQIREALQMLDRASNISCGKVQEALALPSDTTALNEVRKAERERCAKVCDEQYPYSVFHTDVLAAKNCAAAIRKLGEQ